MKLHPIAAIDQLIDSGGKRKLTRNLVLANEDGVAIREISFADDRVTYIISGNKLYDWYGREVAFAADICRIVRYYGGSCLNSDAHEQFIVEKKNGRFAIARLRYEQNPNYYRPPDHKGVLLGKMLYGDPILECGKYDFAHMDTEIIKTPVFQAFIKNSGRDNLSSLAVFYDVRENDHVNDDGKTVVRIPGDEIYPWEFNTFSTISRDEILRLPPGTEPEHDYATWLEGKIEISNDGRKMSAYRPKTWRNDAYRISTDVEVLEHIKQFNLCWYRDPA